MCADRDDGADQAPCRRPYGLLTSRRNGPRVETNIDRRSIQRASGVVALSDEESTTAPVASTSSYVRS
jgi:hypothetical protein